ncbi:hypothetical protein [Roseivirga sp.]|uniref:hypothetical protein n=1 Tax=Roseivirga sp. TaxID=1964215 RepID=UPI002B264CC6|nr:hypothetical protein [Roseivirga sp.]
MKKESVREIQYCLEPTDSFFLVPRHQNDAPNWLILDRHPAPKLRRSFSETKKKLSGMLPLIEIES